MKNKSKIGTEFENVLKNFLLGEGFFNFIIRSAGSKSVVDLVAFKPNNILAHFIQCKSTLRGNLPISISKGKKYKDLENIKVDCNKILAFYNFTDNKLKLFLLCEGYWLSFFNDKIPEKYLYKK